MKPNVLYERDPAMATCRAKIQGFLDFVEGSFRLRDVYEALGAKTTEEKATIRQGLSREKQAGSIEPTGSYGTWRKIDDRVNLVDLSAPVQTQDAFQVELPLGIHTLVKAYPGDLIVVAGRTNAGKSSLALQLALNNVENMPVTYLSSELTPAQIQERALQANIPLDQLKGIRFAMRYENYQDVVSADGGICIVDYLTAPATGDEGAYYKIPHLIAKIHEKVNGSGLLLVLLQKDPGKPSGEGGFKTLHRAALYLTLDMSDDGQYWANILKCKARSQLQGYRMKYRAGRFGLIPETDWLPPKPRKVKDQ